MCGGDDGQGCWMFGRDDGPGGPVGGGPDGPVCLVCVEDDGPGAPVFGGQMVLVVQCVLGMMVLFVQCVVEEVFLVVHDGQQLIHCPLHQYHGSNRENKFWIFQDVTISGTSSLIATSSLGVFLVGMQEADVAKM